MQVWGLYSSLPTTPESLKSSAALLQAVMVLGCSLDTACRLQVEAQGRAFLYCGLDTHAGGLVVYSCPGQAGASRCPRPDLKQVTVAQVGGSLQQSYIARLKDLFRFLFL